MTASEMLSTFFVHDGGGDAEMETKGTCQEGVLEVGFAPGQ